MSEVALNPIAPQQCEMFDTTPRRKIAERIAGILERTYQCHAPEEKTTLAELGMRGTNTTSFVHIIATHFKLTNSAASEIVSRCETFGQLYTALLEKDHK